MQRALIRILIVGVAGLAFWQLASVVLHTHEPWDSALYPRFYLMALGLCATFGYLFYSGPWRWGLIVIFAQLPVMIFHAGAEPLLAVGLAFLALQALPAIAIATAACYLRKRQTRS